MSCSTTPKSDKNTTPIESRTILEATELQNTTQHSVPSALKPLYTAEQIRDRIAELGKKITLDYQGRDLVLVAVLKLNQFDVL